jgi:hypothetical protein
MAQTTPQFSRERARSAPYGLGDACLYVFRGQGLYVLGSYLIVLALLAVLGMVPVLGVGAGCFTLIFVLMVFVIVPGTLMRIVRETAAGENELSNWPEFTEYGDRLAEIVGFLVTGVLAALPLVVMLRLGGCAGSSTLGWHCWAILGGGWFLAMALWVPAFGAVSVLHNNLLAFQLLGHATVLVRSGREFWSIVGLSTILIVAGQMVSLLAIAIPIFGLVASAVIGMYGWFTAAHLVGLFFRRNAVELAEIYGEW